MRTGAHRSAVVQVSQAKVDITVQVDHGGVSSELEHLEGEAADGGHPILEHLHSIVSRAGTPGDGEEGGRSFRSTF